VTSLRDAREERLDRFRGGRLPSAAPFVAESASQRVDFRPAIADLAGGPNAAFHRGTGSFASLMSDDNSATRPACFSPPPSRPTPFAVSAVDEGVRADASEGEGQ